MSDPPRAAVLRGPEEPAAPWEAALGAAGVELEPGGPAGAWPPCVIADGGTPAVLDRVRRARRADPTVQPIIVAEGEERARVQKALLFSPGLGEIWIVDPAELDAGLVTRAAAVGRQRRAHEVRRRRVEHALASLEPFAPQRAVVSDAYLAALLDAAPDAIISVDGDGTVLSWNPGAERVLGFTRQEAVGCRLGEVLVPARGDLPPLPEGGRAVHAELSYRRRNGETGWGDLVIAAVHAGGHRVHAVVLRDLTEERLARAELEDLTGELQNQAAELEERTSELEEALASRSRFYASMSHELRTPLNAIIGYNELLLEGVYGPLSDRQRGGLERSQRAARHLLELIGDVLDLAKIEAGHIELLPEPTIFPHVLEDLAGTVHSLAAERGSTLEVHGAGRHTVHTDPRRLRQILLNLLSNAVKFGEGKPIQVAWHPLRDGGVVVEVIDGGRGIRAEDLPRLFDEFSQFGDRREGGTGLGLAISRRLASALGGYITAESEVDRGSRFRLTLPARISPSA